MRQLKAFLLVATVLAIGASLSACGKKARPADVPGGNYPIQYPNK